MSTIFQTTISIILVSWVVLCGSGQAIAEENLDIQTEMKIYPGDQWALTTAENVDLRPEAVGQLFDLSFQDPATQGVALFKHGQLVDERYADGFSQDSLATSWSMAKSFYAALIGISIARGEIASLDDKVSQYLNYFDDDRRDMTLRQLLNMTSGLEMPEHEHEKMFFTQDHLAYAKNIRLEKTPGEKFEYNNVNSMLLADILFRATGVPADRLLRERILKKIGMDNVTLWRDSSGNPLTYCCIDTTVRQYARFGLLFARSGKWHEQQIIPNQYVDQTFQLEWSNIASDSLQVQRGYSLHWWVSRYENEAKIFNASGKFGQYIFVDPENDTVFVRVTKYHSTGGEVIDWGPLKFVNQFGSVEFRRKLADFLARIGMVNIHKDVKAPMTFDDGVSDQFNTNYGKIIDAMVALNQP
ncbi:beta-lactamase family protein [Porticoccaceae bacterium]|nr:beta-lactamase family protein [Porticoccaceae bacterium]MDA9570177.1 beta-lactamase family protein [Porticoccaceae bacterium]